MPVALITGANSGIGRETALRLASLGFHVVAAGRSETRLQPVADEITNRGGTAEVLRLDLASLASVTRAADEFAATGRPLDLLVNNAGIGVNRRGLTEDGFEVHFGINHLGHFALTQRLAPQMPHGSRVVSLASAVHYRAHGIDFDRMRRPTRFIGLAEYGVSKLANVLFIREMAQRHPDLRAYAVHPGFVDTGIIPVWLRPFVRRSLITPARGADTVVWCATSEGLSGESGGYYHDMRQGTASEPGRDDTLAAELWDRSTAWVA